VAKLTDWLGDVNGSTDGRIGQIPGLARDALRLVATFGGWVGNCASAQRPARGRTMAA
jgi:hypothetical protein